MKTGPERDIPDRAAAYGLLASTVVALVPHVEHLPWWLSLFIVALSTWRYFMLRRGWPAPERWVRVVLVVGVAVAIFRQYGTIFGRDAGSSLLAAMLALKFLELRRLRDYMLALFLIYFLIAVGFLYSQDMWLVFYLGAAFVTTTATLVRLALPGLAGRRALRIALVLLAQALPLMLIMHLLFPRIQGSLWGMPRDAFAGRTGLSEQMRPGSINELSRSDELVFRAYFPVDPPRPADRYWRAVVLTRTDGLNWTRDSGIGTAPHETPMTPVLSYTMVLEPSGKPWIPALEYPSSWPDNFHWGAAATLTAGQPVHTRRIIELSAATTHRSRAITAGERRAALQQPFPGERVAALAGQLRAGRSDREIIDATLAHFRTEKFFYTLEPPILGDNPLDEFLFETRRGFCEHYAAAFVALMRASGLPARVVTGYQGGEHNPTNQSLVVRQSDAHAWAEVWLENQGWVRVDPTTAVAPERVELGAEGLRGLVARGLQPGTGANRGFQPDWLDRVRRDAWLVLDTLQSAWQRWVLSYDADRQRQLLASLGAGAVRGVQLVGLLAILVALVIGAYIVLTRQRPLPIDPVQRQYLRLCRKLARAGVPRAPHEGPLDFLGRSARHWPELAGALTGLAEFYVTLRYGPTVNPEQVAEFARSVAALRPVRR